MKNAINYVALFYEVGSSTRDFSRNLKIREIVKTQNVCKDGYYPQITQKISSFSYVFICFSILTLNQQAFFMLISKASII